jgi:hypothetical protein
MMKLLFSFFLIFVFDGALSQNKPQILKGTYYTLLPIVASMSISGDSLITGYPFNKASRKSAIQIVELEKKGDYTFVYIKLKPIEPVGRLKFLAANSRPFGVYILNTAGDRLFVLQENAMFYATLDDVKKAYAYKKIEDRYFITWYSQSAFDQFRKYPNLSTADKGTMQQVVDEYIAEYKKNKDRIEIMKDDNAFRFSTNIWTKCLIEHHLNPVVANTEIWDKILACHMAIPAIRRAENNKTVLHFDTAYSKMIVIDEPVAH